MALERPLRFSVLMPVRDDWSSAAELIRRLERIFASEACDTEIILVDDASLERCERDDFQINSSSIRVIRTLRLRRNVGHQRAIAIGLVHVQQTSSCDAVIVMDADGEDTPEGVSQLLRAYCEGRGRLAVFAERSRRSESLLFLFFYHLYKLVHRCLTGISVRVGHISKRSW
jgi:glycosyltransferase involved in cell wall biosynthesis